MDNRQEEKGFSYTYSAREQEEIKRIREKYAPREEDTMERLRRMDGGVTKKARGISIALGIVGTLILGFGMSLAMTELSDRFGLQKDYSVLLGAIIGGAGILLICLAFPLYQAVVKRERKKIAPEIIRLTDELMK